MNPPPIATRELAREERFNTVWTPGLNDVFADVAPYRENPVPGARFRALELVGGMGSDTFNVGGGNDGNAITVVSNSLSGHSGLIVNTVASTDPAYNAIFAQDVSAQVHDNDAPGAVVDLVDGSLLVFEESATNFFGVSDPRAGKDTVKPSTRDLYLHGGFKPGHIYEFIYPAQNPLVLGLGFTVARDLISFLR